MSVTQRIALPERGTVTVEKNHWGGIETRTIDVVAWPDFQERGWSLVSVQPLLPEPEPATPPAPAPAVGTLWPRERLLRAGGQSGQWAEKTVAARRAVDEAANQLAPYLGLEPIPREQNTGGNLAPSAVRATDMLGNAYVARTVVLLLERITTLEHEVAALRLEVERNS